MIKHKWITESYTNIEEFIRLNTITKQKCTICGLIKYTKLVYTTRLQKNVFISIYELTDKTIIDKRPDCTE